MSITLFTSAHLTEHENRKQILSGQLKSPTANEWGKTCVRFCC
jgi:hypothetical protein